MFLWLIPIMTEHRPGRAVVRRFALHGRVHPFCMSGITHWFVFFVPNPSFEIFMLNMVNKTWLMWNWHLRVLAILLALLGPLAARAADSQCYGTVSHGRIEGSVKLPLSGTNFSVYSTLAATVGRTHVHSTVAVILEKSYQALAVALPQAHYVYGETGWPSGGRFRPHRTHQNGLSVDFFVPVKDGQGHSVPLPTSTTNKFGYDIEFDQNARYGDYSIDFEAMAEHLYQLDLAAKAVGAGLALVIFDRTYLPQLFATRRGAYLKNLPFMQGKPWVRHDEHYHVDFRVRCKPELPS